MAEYMDISRIDDWDNLSILDDDGNAKFVYDVGELPRADVVERSEYDNMVKYLNAQVHNKEICLRHNREAFRRVVKRYDKLCNNIDKAYKEMEEFKKEVESINDLYAQSCVVQCMAILKENIGEK
jgi:hypothetical protein